MREIDYQVLFTRCMAPASSLEKKVAEQKLLHIIYLFPVKRFHATWDVAGDFYIFAQRHLNAILSGYVPAQETVSFHVYLAVKLGSLYRNFLSRRKQARDPATEAVSWDDQLTLEIEPPDNETDEWHLLVRNELAKMEFRERTTLSLCYGLPLTIRDLRNLVSEDMKIGDVFKAYRAYLLEQRNISIKNKAKIRQIKEKIAKKEQKAEQKGSKAHITDLRESIVDNMLSLTSKVKLKTVAAIFGENQSSTARRLQRAQVQLKKQLSLNINSTNETDNVPSTRKKPAKSKQKKG